MPPQQVHNHWNDEPRVLIRLAAAPHARQFQQGRPHRQGHQDTAEKPTDECVPAALGHWSCRGWDRSIAFDGSVIALAIAEVAPVQERLLQYPH